MAGNIKGITVEIGGNTGPLDKALQGVNKTSRDLQAELRQVDKLLKLDPTNTELLSQKHKILAESVDNTKDKLLKLKEAEKQVQQQFKDGKVPEQQYRALQREVVSTEQSLKKLESQGKQTNAVLSKDDAVKNLKNIGIAAGATAVAVGAAMVGMASAVVNNADELQRQADVTGLTAERLQELQYAGKNLGVELDTITGAQAKLTKAMAAAKDGTGAQADAFKALGINVIDSNGQLRDAKDVMTEAFTALGNVGNETERDALAMQLFGKSAMEMNPLIKAGGDELKKLTDEARKNGAVMSDEAVAGLDSFGDTIDNIKSGVLGAFGEGLAGLMPSIQALLDNLIQLPQWIKENSTLLEIIGVVIGTITALIIAFNIQQALMAGGMTLWSVVAGVGTTITTALGAAFAFLTSPIGLVILAIGAVIAIGVLLYKNWDTIKEACSVAWGAIISTIKGAIDGIRNFFNGIIDFIKNNWQVMLLLIANPFLGAFKLLYDNCAGFRNFVDNFVKGIITFITEKIPSFITTMIEWFKRLPSAMLDIGKNIVSGIWDGITGMAGWLWDKVTGFVGGIVDGIKDALKINSPSQVLADEVGKYMAMGIGAGFETEMGSVSTNMAKAIPKTPVSLMENSGIAGAASNGNAISGSAEATLSIPLVLDGKVLTNVVSKIQYSNGRFRARGIGVVTQ